MAGPSEAIALPSEAIALVEQGQLIEAIKLVRERQGVDLKTAKDQVDRYLASRPELRDSLRAKQADALRKLKTWAILLLGLGLIAYFVLARRS